MTPTVDNIPITDLLDLVLRSGCREWSCPPQSICEALKKADPMESYCHVELGSPNATKVWDIKTWKDSEEKREKLRETMTVVRGEYDKQKEKREKVLETLKDKYGNEMGLKIFNQIINGELPKLKEKFGI